MGTTNQQYPLPKEVLAFATNKKATGKGGNSAVQGNAVLRSWEKEAIFSYTTSAYKFINDSLRLHGVQNLRGGAQRKVERILSGLEKLQPYEGIVWRGCGEDVGRYFDLEVGSVFCDKAFLSTSTKKDVAVNSNFLPMTNGFVFEISHHSGKEITALSNEGENECEVLFLPDTKYRIERVQEGVTFGYKTNVTCVWMTEVGGICKAPGMGNDVFMTETTHQCKDSKSKWQNDVDEELPNASSETALHEKKDIEDDENIMLLDNTSASEGVTNIVPQKDGRHSVIPNSFNELGSQWIDGRRRSARLQPHLGSVFVNGLRQSARFL
jgi:hypothetical protein